MLVNSLVDKLESNSQINNSSFENFFSELKEIKSIFKEKFEENIQVSKFNNDNLSTLLNETKTTFQDKLNENIESIKTANNELILELKSFKTNIQEKLEVLSTNILSKEESSSILLKSINESLDTLQSENKEFNLQSIKNSDSIISAMTQNNGYIIKKFETFSELLAKNNTEALVDVMKNVTETFNNQMNELIQRLVKENFEELNNSVQAMNTWQKENKEQITELTNNYKKTTELFTLSSETLLNVTSNIETLNGENSKLNELVLLMNKTLIEENNFTEITTKLANTVEILQTNTKAFDKTTNKLNEWVRTERNFKDAADLLIIKLEQFRDLNSDVWKQYRKEMESAVGIIEQTSLTISKNISNIDEEFYERLSSTLENLDMCIQRAISKYDK